MQCSSIMLLVSVNEKQTLIFFMTPPIPRFSPSVWCKEVWFTGGHQMHSWCNDISDICSCNDGRCESHLTHRSLLAKIPTLVSLEMFWTVIKVRDCVRICQMPNISELDWGGNWPQILWNTHTHGPLIFGNLFIAPLWFYHSNLFQLDRVEL